MSKRFGDGNSKRVGSICGLMACLLTAACATAPDKVKASYVSADPFRTLSCEQLGAESNNVSAALARDTARQKRTRIVDGVGLALILLPVGSLTGGDHSHEISDLTGKQNALWRAEADQKCVTDGQGAMRTNAASVKTQGANPTIPSG